MLAEQTHAVLREHPWDVVVLPFGATEPHNLALQFLSETGLIGFLLVAGAGVAVEEETVLEELLGDLEGASPGSVKRC